MKNRAGNVAPDGVREPVAELPPGDAAASGRIDQMNNLAHDPARSASPACVRIVGAEQMFTDAAVRGLIDEWIVPALVERFIEEKLVKQAKGDRLNS